MQQLNPSEISDLIKQRIDQLADRLADRLFTLR